MTWFKHLLPGFKEASKGKQYEAPKKQLTPVSVDPRSANPMQFYALQANNLTGQQVGLGGMQVINGNFQPVQPQKKQGGGELPTAPKAEVRYQNGVKDSVAYLGVPFKDSSYFGESIKRVKTPGNASIERRILFRYYPHDNDTTYTEIPEHSKYKIYPIKTKVQPRQATNSDVKYVKRNKDGFISYIPTTPSDEYATLKKRFNTAWNIAK